MALITCTECGHTVSTKAAACPKCGVPVAGMLDAKSAQEPIPSPKSMAQSASKAKLVSGLMLLTLVVGAGAYAYSSYQQRAARIAAEKQQQEDARIAEEARKAEEQAALEAEEGGFASVDEMRDLQQRGFQTKADYVEAQQREQAEARERQLAEERARDPYPYLAVLQCRYMGMTNVIIEKCFIDRGRRTVLKLRNGNQQFTHKFQAEDIRRLGRYNGDKFEIALGHSFDLEAQNASEESTLGIRVLDKVSGKVLFGKAAEQYEVISVSN